MDNNKDVIEEEEKVIFKVMETEMKEKYGSRKR